MRVIIHAKSPKPTEMTLSVDPLRIWLTSVVELVIERGDCLYKVTQPVVEHWGVPKRKARRIVATWFALGERSGRSRQHEDWSLRETRVTPGRIYKPARSKER